jgi:hypothetical protein
MQDTWARHITYSWYRTAQATWRQPSSCCSLKPSMCLIGCLFLILTESLKYLMVTIYTEFVMWSDVQKWGSWCPCVPSGQILHLVCYSNVILTSNPHRWLFHCGQASAIVLVKQICSHLHWHCITANGFRLCGCVLWRTGVNSLSILVNNQQHKIVCMKCIMYCVIRIKNVWEVGSHAFQLYISSPFLESWSLNIF